MQSTVLHSSTEPLLNRNAGEQQYTRIETITPQVAQGLLDTMVGQRRMRPRIVATYARQMQLGHWVVNNQSIGIAQGGRLLDGQHRLQACIDSGLALTTLVTFNMDPEVFATIDDGLARTYADAVFTNKGGAAGHSRVLASAAVWYRRYLLGEMSRHMTQPSNQEIAEFEILHPELDGATLFIEETFKGVARPWVAPVGISVAMFVAFSNKDPLRAQLFMQKLLRGTGITDGEPVHRCRNYLMRLLNPKDLKINGGGKAAAAAIVTAWNYERAGKSPGRFTVKLRESDGSTYFPVIK